MSKEDKIMKNTTTTVRTQVNNDGTVSVNFSTSKSIIVPGHIYDQIKDFIGMLSWGELSSLVAHATNGVNIYSDKDRGNSNPNADRNWGRRK